MRTKELNGRLEVVSHGQPVEVDGVRIEAGDLVVGDADGVVVVPRALCDEVLAFAIDKGSRENLLRAAVAKGMKPSVAFDTYGVL